MDLADVTTEELKTALEHPSPIPVARRIEDMRLRRRLDAEDKLAELESQVENLRWLIEHNPGGLGGAVGIDAA